MVKHVLLLGFVLTLMGYQGFDAVGSPGETANEELGQTTVGDAEKARNKRARAELVAFMSLKTMFPDPRVRALAKAARRGRISKIDKLVDEGVDVNARGTSNATPLFWPMQKNNIKGFKRLLELGADPNVIYDDGGSVMHWAAQHPRSDEYLKLALEHGGNPNLYAGIGNSTPLFDAVLYGHRSKVAILVDAGADMDFQNSIGITPMIDAVYSASFNIILDLLERGADYRYESCMGKSLASSIGYLLSPRRRSGVHNPELQKIVDWLTVRGVEIPEWRPLSKEERVSNRERCFPSRVAK